eukprot:GHVH01007446.1.p1 GENE.GHVH01007446.1~~GHVH01007446.1.p1  ORF type:complete len:207 (+),score=28.74 GHVH01007446.1:25-621(+)
MTRDGTAQVKKKQRNSKNVPVLSSKKDKRSEGVDEEPSESSKKYKHPHPLKRGVVFLARLPPTFTEGPLQQYFSQFGTVTRVRRKRSKKTGNPLTYGWVEFADYEVAGIVAKHANSYLLSGRRLYAERLEQGPETSMICSRRNSVYNHTRTKEDGIAYAKARSDIDLKNLSAERKSQLKECLNKQLKKCRGAGIEWSC